VNFRVVPTFEGKNNAFLNSFNWTEIKKVPRNSKTDIRNTSAT